MASIHSEFYREMIELLRIGRLKKRMLQRDVAKQLGVDASLISRIETCESKLDMVDYFKIAHIVGVTDEEILKCKNAHLK